MIVAQNGSFFVRHCADKLFLVMHINGMAYKSCGNLYDAIEYMDDLASKR